MAQPNDGRFNTLHPKGSDSVSHILVWASMYTHSIQYNTKPKQHTISVSRRLSPSFWMRPVLGRLLAVPTDSNDNTYLRRVIVLFPTFILYQHPTSSSSSKYLYHTYIFIRSSTLHLTVARSIPLCSHTSCTIHIPIVNFDADAHHTRFHSFFH
jgi:hypothetical protein